MYFRQLRYRLVVLAVAVSVVGANPSVGVTQTPKPVAAALTKPGDQLDLNSATPSASSTDGRISRRISS